MTAIEVPCPTCRVSARRRCLAEERISARISAFSTLETPHVERIEAARAAKPVKKRRRGR